MTGPVLQRLIDARQEGRALLYILVDPDNLHPNQVGDFITRCDTAGVDGFLVGGSLSLSGDFTTVVSHAKAATTKPVIIFPGGYHHVTGTADAILFLSMVSSRNPDHLIGQQVLAAPMIARLGIEPISTAYMLIESDRMSTVEFMSYSKPIPRRKPDIALAHALAAEMIGMRCLYLEAGSGAGQPVPVKMIAEIHRRCSLPILTGGGITDPDQARERVAAGATCIVIGNHFEKAEGIARVQDFARAVHDSGSAIPV